jgi:antitoxin HicB
MSESFSCSLVLDPQEGGGFTMLVPALPEVVREGDTGEEAPANAHEAIQAILSYRRDHGSLRPPQ